MWPGNFTLLGLIITVCLVALAPNRDCRITLAEFGAFTVPYFWLTSLVVAE